MAIELVDNAAEFQDCAFQNTGQPIAKRMLVAEGDLTEET
jgi:hypothetical protein